MELMQNNICNKYIQVGKLNCHKLFFTDFFNWNWMGVKF